MADSLFTPVAEASSNCQARRPQVLEMRMGKRFAAPLRPGPGQLGGYSEVSGALQDSPQPVPRHRPMTASHPKLCHDGHWRVTTGRVGPYNCCPQGLPVTVEMLRIGCYRLHAHSTPITEMIIIQIHNRNIYPHDTLSLINTTPCLVKNKRFANKPTKR